MTPSKLRRHIENILLVVGVMAFVAFGIISIRTPKDVRHDFDDECVTDEIAGALVKRCVLSGSVKNLNPNPIIVKIVFRRYSELRKKEIGVVLAIFKVKPDQQISSPNLWRGPMIFVSILDENLNRIGLLNAVNKHRKN